ncbi:MAG: nucleotide sugar dehydrogenase, partial [Planctomycetota bacterium]
AGSASGVERGMTDAGSEAPGIEPARTETVGIVGLGAVGLPLAALFARAGLALVLVDVDPERVAAVRAGRSPLAHLGDGVVESFAGAEVTSDFSALARCGAVVIAVPTPLDSRREPDLGAVCAAAASVRPHLAQGALVVLESTTWPGTTREVLGPMFAGLEGVSLAYSPERVDPGRVDPLKPDGDPLGRAVPKLVGGLDARATERAVALYARAFDTVVPTPTAEVAEAAKLVENVHRAVNIALVGELKIAFDAMGIDVWEVLDAAATKPFGFTRFDPGPGMGGHCLPIDPFYLAWAARRSGAEARFVELSGEINRAMPDFVAAKTRAALASRGVPLDGARVLLVGVAYKRGVGITEESPAFPLADALAAGGASVRYVDPLVPRCRLGETLALDAEVLAETDVAVVLVDQDGVDVEQLAASDALVVDTRAALRSRLRGDPRYFSA